MTNRKKAGGLVLLLAVPLLIIVFLEEFGKQHYTVPTDPAQAEGFSATVPASALGQNFRFSTPPINYRGNAVSEALLRGKATIIYFLPTINSDTAQVVLERLTAVQNVFESRSEVQLWVVVATSQTDNLPKLAQQYRSQEATWQFLADTTQKDISHPMLPPNATSATLLLVDPHQKVRGYYDGMEEEEIDRLILETRVLLYDVK